MKFKIDSFVTGFIHKEKERKMSISLYGRYFLTALVALSIFSQTALAAGPPPKVCIPVERSYYLTEQTYQGNDIFGHCEAGYHVASVFELLDVSNLIYNNQLGKTHLFSGDGPPAGADGWMLLGDNSNSTHNCYSWTSNNSFQSGSIGSLSAGNLIDGLDPWDLGFDNCNKFHSVWCISDAVY